MGWENTWDDIIAGGSPRWKVTDKQSHLKALELFKQHVKTEAKETSVLCPLAGDDPFVNLLFENGYSVTTIDLVPAAVEQLKKQFGSSNWTREATDDAIIWKHESGRVTLIVGDALKKYPQLLNKFDAVYDKDSFGALDKDKRQIFCTRIAEYTKTGAKIYLECKLKENHQEVKHIGPPFSLTAEELMEESCYGKDFDYAQGLGSVYEISMPMHQTGHILIRK